MAGNAEQQRTEEIKQTIRQLTEQLGTRTAEVNQLKSQLEHSQGDERTQEIQQTVRQLTEQLGARMAEVNTLKTQLEQAQVQIETLQHEQLRALGGALAVGGRAWVRKAGGMNLNLRDAPGLESNVIGSLPPGTELFLNSGPNPAHNYTWWQVRVTDGREGWVAGEELVTQPE